MTIPRRPRMAEPVTGLRDVDRTPAGPAAPQGPADLAPHLPPPPNSQPQQTAVESLPSQSHHPHTIREMIARADQGWQRFRSAAAATPSERMDDRLTEDGWTRKQMLAHVAAWHDMTSNRMGKMLTTGQPAEMTEKTDAVNARVARQAMGRSAGEVMQEMEASYHRLRRQLLRVTDEQLTADDNWAASVIAADTYEHYDEHMADLAPPEQPEGRGPGRR